MSNQLTNNEHSVVQTFIGRKVNLDIMEKSRGEGANNKIYKFYKVNDPGFVKDVNAITSSNRILPPGTGTTMEHLPFRLNISINEEGIVTDVYYG